MPIEKTPMIWIRIASLWMFLGVALGALGAHLWKDRLGEGRLDLFQKGILYHLIHGIAMLGVAGWSVMFQTHAFHGVNLLFSFGILLFSGSLYGLALTHVKKWAMLTPFGGICFMLGWLTLFFTAGSP